MFPKYTFNDYCSVRKPIWWEKRRYKDVCINYRINLFLFFHLLWPLFQHWYLQVSYLRDYFAPMTDVMLHRLTTHYILLALNCQPWFQMVFFPSLTTAFMNILIAAVALRPKASHKESNFCFRPWSTRMEIVDCAIIFMKLYCKSKAFALKMQDYLREIKAKLYLIHQNHQHCWGKY